jgi:pSer/pThr/pTyr-binding forkhead associated (FHA) protein
VSRWQTPSDHNALIQLQNIGELWLIDFGSSNGTFLKKRRIHRPIRLRNGDQITIGDQIFKLRKPIAISEKYKTDVMQQTFRGIEDILCWLILGGAR